MAFEGEDARRWSITDAPTLQPAVDFITKSPNGPFIDTGLNVTFEQRGRVYLSIETIREMAEIAGLLTSYNAQERNLHDTALYNEGYKAGLEESGNLLGKLTDISTRLTSSDFASVLHDVEVVAEPEGNAGVESGIADGNSDDVPETSTGSRKSRGKTSSASSSKRSDDFPSPSDDNPTFKL